jgi:hypothetical protein
MPLGDPSLPLPLGIGFGAPQLGHIIFVANTVFILFLQLTFGHCQSPGCRAFLHVPQLGQEEYFPKTIAVEFMQSGFGHGQSSGLSAGGCMLLPLAMKPSGDAPHLGHVFLEPNTFFS